MVAPPPAPVTPRGRCSRDRSHPHPASRFPGSSLRRRSPTMPDSFDTLQRQRALDRREEKEEEEKKGRKEEEAL